MGKALLRTEEEVLAAEKRDSLATMERLNAAIETELQRKQANAARGRKAMEEEVRSAEALEAESILQAGQHSELISTLVKQTVNRRKSTASAPNSPVPAAR
jgi:hypothetical protein